ncbi:DUF4136 domain-containing protein [Marivirga sp.]|uniref:DUF4136 domain-containing protein n=1 Tax=Marivirga sp. TaxID=2018662 RepID=UPI002D808D2F|nr:DUF4136 domain-containing protein [Marivirga sp.]HET8859585.1 DUF4136 domain-containing protein [Marivirga sp.]
MKNLIVFITAFFIISNLNAQDVQTELRDGIIDKDYESFSILNSEMELAPDTREAMIIADDYMAEIITYTDPIFPSLGVINEVEDAITHELIAAGYKHEKSGADMVVIFSIYSKDGKISGDFNNDDYSSIEKYDVSKGTLLISIIDRESGATVWSGYNDGALEGVSSLEENKLITSVTEIMNNLRFENY